MPIFPHLSLRALVPLSEGALELSARQRDHLAACDDCRTQLRELRALTASARAIAGSAPSDAMLARIHARIDAGERVILPSPPSIRRPAVSRRALGLAAACAVAAIAAALWIARPVPVAEAGATTGALEISPQAPRPGDSLQVWYRAPARLAGERVLHLRGRLRRPNDESYGWTTSQRFAAVLRLGEDGLYRGKLRLPDSIPYAVFAVEDTSGERVDDHNRQLWEVLAHGPDGRPTYAALWQREQDLTGRNMELALATSRRRAELYPDLPYAWAELYAIESYGLGESEQRRREYRERLARLSDRWAAVPNPPFAIVDGLLSYAAQVSDGRDSLGRAIRARWRPLRERVIANDPSDPALVDARWWRLNEMAMKHPDSVQVALALAERFWNGSGRTTPMGAMIGLQIAQLARDTGDARLRWVDRMAATQPGHAEGLYAVLAHEPALRPVAIERLAALLRALRAPDDARRPLEATRSAAARDDSARARRALGMLADARLAGGDTAGARAAYLEATAAGWDHSLIQHAMSTLLASNDTAHAFALSARLAVDPATPVTTVDSLARRAVSGLGEARWLTMVADARRMMRDYFLGDATRMTLPREIALSDTARRRTTLVRLTAGRVSVVMFWDRTCPWALEQLPQLPGLAARLRDRGVAFVPVVTDAPSPEEIAFLREHAMGAPVYFDVSAEARRAFGQWSTPEYYVLDERGLVRFKHSALDLVLTQAIVLLDASGD